MALITEVKTKIKFDHKVTTYKWDSTSNEF